MLDPKHPLAELLRRDGRYHFDSYVFIFDSLRYAQEKLNMGRVAAPSPHSDAPGRQEGERQEADASYQDNEAEDFDDDFDDDLNDDLDDEDFDDEDYVDDDFDNDYGEDDLAEEFSSETEKHITGQDLCEAIRQYALSQYGLLARSVFDHWGIHSTGDFGEIVFNLIDIGQMRKTDNDRREDFENVFDFDEALWDETVFRAAKSLRRKGDEERKN